MRLIIALMMIAIAPAFAQDAVTILGTGNVWLPDRDVLFAQDNTLHIGNRRSMVTAPPCMEMFKGLPAFAKRLGVPPASTDHPVQGGVALKMCDGTTYDFFELSNAVLDKLDAATR